MRKDETTEQQAEEPEAAAAGEGAEEAAEGAEEAAREGEEEEDAAATAEGDGEGPHITDADAEEIARQASRPVSFRALVKGPSVATNSENQDCFKVGLSVTGGDLNLYQLHQEVARFANSTVLVSLEPLPDLPATPHPQQLELGEGEETVVELVMCPDCAGSGVAVIGNEADEDVEGNCPTCEGEGEIPLAKLADTTFRLLRCEGCGACFSTKDAENAQPGKACPTCTEAILAFVEPPTEEPPGEPAEEAEQSDDG